MHNLFEGGNVFKGPDKQSLTQRIGTSDVPATIDWIENATGLDFTAEKGEDQKPVKWLGTTGRKENSDGTFELNSSGDLDLSVDANEVDKKEFAAKLMTQFGKDSVKLSGDNVHLKTPIKGDPENGFVQADFMFSNNTKFQQGSMIGGQGEYRGEHRHIVLSSIARARGMKYSPKYGIVDPETNEPVPGGDDWNTIAKQLLGQTASVKDIKSVDAILNYIEKLPNYEELIAAARETLGRQGVKLPEAITFESAQTGTPAWFRRMMSRVR
jgi:hypothetical protein|tara:strand:- start:14739 stop:15545 length:807 start_codon:yes stop_codon:yes gene_type:complete